ncbi:MAG: hypothetical protein K5768_09145 [Firmicutes bacterium]|nr:hypothetical protein [Bacillota bacterium]
MPRETTNYNFQKPLYTENADIAVINADLDSIDTALTPTVSAVTAPTSGSTGGKLSVVLGWIANRLKAITGLSSWQATPFVNLEDCKNHILSGTHATASQSSSGFMSAADKAKLDNATDSNVASRLIIRDSGGRAKVASPSSTYDIANKTYVDTNFVKKNADTTMTAKLTAQSNTSYTTKQVRNIVFWTSGDTPPTTSNGDVVIKTF